ncbi:MAG TPA: FecR domain-containing protein [Polyangiaceae bacterium]|nr:FecR domain-containing protein [Polyangiaceae bacterium]
MNIPSYARAAARLLRGTPRPAYVPSTEARVRSLRTIESALLSRQRRVRGWWLATLAAVAAAFVGGIAVPTAMRDAPAEISLWVTSTGSGASLTDAGGTHAFTGRIELAAGSSVTTSERGSATFRLSTGTSLSLAEEASLQVAGVGRAQRFRLTQGSVEARVSKLKPGERFTIETLDASVEVRGTAFRVTVLEPGAACDGGVRTRVHVREGVVKVSARGKSSEVRANQSWPAACDSEVAKRSGDHARGALADEARQPPTLGAEAQRFTATPEQVAPERRSRRQAAALATGSQSSPAPEPSPRSSLSHQNDKFEVAVRARRSGDFRAALQSYRDFVREFPTSPLSENARVEVMRLLARSNATAAAEAASDYLDHHPTGFARAEAARLLAAP